MNGVSAIRTYVDRLVTGDGRCNGMKALLLDASTTQIVSCVYSQSEVLSREVYLVSRLDDVTNINNATKQSNIKDSAPVGHLKAIVYLRPTDINAGLLVKELKRPRFGEYHIFFSGIVPTSILRMLAENDERELVRQIQEFYGDFLPINEDLVTLNCRHTLAMTASAGTSWARDHAHVYERNLVGLQSILLAMKKQPRQIRYQTSSALASQLARDIHEKILSDQIFHFRQSSHKGGTLLLVLDRMDDPLTPLLSQWTYQAMVHELLGINNNRVILKGAPNITPDLHEVVLSSSSDDFFHNNKHSNFGQLGEAIQTLLKDYQQKTQTTHNLSSLNTIEDMQAFMDKFPQLKSQSHNVSKHVALMGELARLVDTCSLMDVSQFEQELACADDQSIHFRELMDKLQSSHIQIPDKLRLGLLFALRYEHSANLHKVRAEMKKGGVSEHSISLIDTLIQYAGSNTRGPGLYGIGSKDIVSKMTKSILTSVQGVSNVYSQHSPVLIDTLNAILRGKLKMESHPYIIGRPRGPTEREVPEDIIVFMVGGVTYEEATKVAEFNKLHRSKLRVLLAGSTIHNSTSFLEELKTLP
mmetsp:Transcript_23098/g.32544  ORF Transcript_23098/g.32544 Transcript_23098/m.32544 type:complete len:585 (+) Transcript_23098:177-1931(+)|eukprot:CAMPEP_0184866366 /NCGR_PEP_ID=MMETSP0580-20130426/22082_1 /TAXON_ID=1118495 /ORGANISM="Dactyliosolen fragilissimus" /LENGTH=584 /DNA_ID=CAMNT_0027366033 /DNA_START=85 /DNA_END=1839 /DNA_ORIENTATION=-